MSITVLGLDELSKRTQFTRTIWFERIRLLCAECGTVRNAAGHRIPKLPRHVRKSLTINIRQRPMHTRVCNVCLTIERLIRRIRAFETVHGSPGRNGRKIRKRVFRRFAQSPSTCGFAHWVRTIGRPPSTHPAQPEEFPTVDG